MDCSTYLFSRRFPVQTKKELNERLKKFLIQARNRYDSLEPFSARTFSHLNFHDFHIPLHCTNSAIESIRYI